MLVRNRYLYEKQILIGYSGFRYLLTKSELTQRIYDLRRFWGAAWNAFCESTSTVADANTRAAFTCKALPDVDFSICPSFPSEPVERVNQGRIAG